MKKLLLGISLSVACSLTACGEGAFDPDDGTDTLDSEIVNGSADSGHPSVGKLRVSGKEICTATLIGKKTVLCAAHCIVANSVSAYSFVLGSKAYPASDVTVHPRWDNEADDGEGINDLSVILLKDAPPVTPSAIATSAPKVGENVALVGFGVTSDAAQNFGTKRITYNAIGQIASTKIYWDPASDVGTTCYGDSGGPAFATVNGEEVQVGITSGGQSPCEWGYAWDTRVDLFASWISSAAHGDVVKQGGSSTHPSASADHEKPKVHISSPKSNSTVSAGTVSVKSTITDNVGVARGELWVDGALAKTLSAAPYTFSVKLTKGTHEVRVFGYDAAGNSGHYTVHVQAK